MIALAKAGENTVKAFLESKGLQVEKIPEQDIKTVDFAVYTRDFLAFYLEEKTLEPASQKWKRIDPIYQSIASHVHEAAKQFKSVNPDRSVPNVLSFTNLDPGRDVNYLFTALTGQAITRSGKVVKLEEFGNRENVLNLIDLYLWFDGEEITGHIWEDEIEPNYQGFLKEKLGL